MFVSNFDEFIAELRRVGFTQFGGPRTSLATIIPCGYGDPPVNGVRWFSDAPDHDPCYWRARVLDHFSDITYAKMIQRKAAYITREWYPYFLAVRRKNRTFLDDYNDGKHSYASKQVHDVLYENGPMPVHELRIAAGFAADKKTFEKALADLQMGLFVTISGYAQKISKAGEPYGWSSDVYCLTEQFWSEEVFVQTAQLDPQAAYDSIAARVLELNPQAPSNQIKKFILG